MRIAYATLFLPQKRGSSSAIDAKEFSREPFVAVPTSHRKGGVSLARISLRKSTAAVDIFLVEWLKRDNFSGVIEG